MRWLGAGDLQPVIESFREDRIAAEMNATLSDPSEVRADEAIEAFCVII